MSHQVLARKYRPRNFPAMVGQEHVLRALINALDQNRLHHAYLFTGTRGTGKTTLARILAKCLNCEKGVSATPCEQCLSCQEISEGRFVDLIEVDAASRTKVEDTRELLENVQYAPTRGRFKVYLIDEVHMLSNHSFNALLKTLEEPPPHIKFLLATTDPQRLPVTVLSRCLQFNLKNLAPEKISTHLAHVLTQENIPYQTAALGLLAKGANGSLRDALSLLDQAVAYGGGQITDTDVRAMLGTIEQTQLVDLLAALAAQDAKSVLTLIAQLAEQAADFNAVLEDLLTWLHRITVTHLVPDASNEDQTQLTALAKQLSLADLQLYYQIGLMGRRDLPLAPTPRSGFEMILLRMLAFTPQQGQEVAPSQTSSIPAPLSRPVAAPTTRADDYPPLRPAAAPTTRPDDYPPLRSALAETQDEWTQLVSKLNLSGFTQALALHCTLKERTDDLIHLALDPNQAALHNAKQEGRLAEALSQYFGKPMRLQVSIGNAALATPMRTHQAKQTAKLEAVTTALQEDENVQTILKLFDAKIKPGSIQLKDSDP